MKIRNKLLLNFALLLGAHAAGLPLQRRARSYREHEAKAALNNAYELSLATESVRHQIVENHLALSNYLITGTPVRTGPPP